MHSLNTLFINIISDIMVKFYYIHLGKGKIQGADSHLNMQADISMLK